MSKTLKVGDRVKIKGFRRTVSWGDFKPEQFGHVVDINGAYILIHPRWKPRDFLIERYPSEVTLSPRRRRSL